MSQTSKRPGARDISDLKARLGLKKTGSAPGGAPARPPAQGGIVPPPGANSGGSIPAPPGLAAPQPHIPDASADPFGAMGAMAQQARVAAQPEMIIINDGNPVENVAKKNKAMTLGKTAALVLAPLIAGVLIGKVGQSASQYNQVITDAAPIRDDVKLVRRGLTELSATLESGKVGGKFTPGDQKLTEALAALKPIEGDYELIYESSLYHLDSAISREIYTFYSDIQGLSAKLKEHVRIAKTEEKILKEGAVKFASFNPMAYGAILKIPKAEDAAAGAPVTFKVVQLGGPTCEGQTRPDPVACQGKPVTGFAYRDDETAAWSVDRIAPATEEGIPTDSVVMLDPKSKTIKQIIQGGQVTVAEAAYAERIEALATQTAQMLDTGKKIEAVLNEKSNEGGKFSFGL